MTFKLSSLYTLICGALCMILGVCVMAGWYTNTVSLIQINPKFAPMQFNSALTFLVAGAASVFLALKMRPFAQFFGFLVFLMGVANLLQYVLETNLGIDQFFMDHTIHTKTSHPGRMAPNSALCFSFCGLTLLISGLRRDLVISLPLSVLILAILSLAGYIFHYENMYGWGHLTRMALHTAIGFLILGSGLVFHGFYDWSKKKFDFWQLMPFAVATIVGILSFFTWYVVEEETKARNTAYFEGLADDTQGVLTRRFDLYLGSLRGGLGLYYASQSIERNEWKQYADALKINETLPGINGIGYIDYVPAADMDAYVEQTRSDGFPTFEIHPNTFYPDKFVIKFIEPVENNIEAVGLDIGFEANRRTAAERARDLGIPTLTKKIILVQDNKQQPGFLLLVPIYDTKNTPPTLEERREHIQGWVYAPFVGANFLDGIANINKNQLTFEVYDGHKTVPQALIYSNAKPEFSMGKYKNIYLETHLNIAGQTWTIVWHPSDNYSAPANENLALTILICGLGFAVFLYFALGLLVRSKEIISEQVDLKTSELRETTAFKDLVIQNIPDLVFVKDSEFRIVQANAVFLSVYPEEFRESVIGSTTVEKFDKKEAEEFLKFDKQALEEGYSETEETLTLPNGERRTFLSKKVGFKNAEGQKFILGISRDITERKRTQEKILVANKELERSNHELERFAYIASHDLQEPLRKIGGFTERLQEKLTGQLDEQGQTYMKFIIGGVERMRELIQGLLAYSHVTTSESKLQKLDTNEIVELAMDNLSETISETNAVVSFKALPSVYYDKVMLTQLFQNLIGNAIKYRSERPPRIDISAHEQNGYWEFHVADNGMGMEDKYLTRIFEMFQRLHRKEDISGTGIGLSLCQKIVERYGGSIRAISKVGEGSTFIFTVPNRNE